MNQGWLIVILTSVTTICGCLVIYTDVLYEKFWPRRWRGQTPFHIADNTKFIVCSLSLSAGCLTFVSLYKLLPSTGKYLHQVPCLEDNPLLLRATTMACYISGITCCALLNVAVHLMTSESVVHCVHDVHGADGDHKFVHEHEVEGECEAEEGHDDDHEIPATHTISEGSSDNAETAPIAPITAVSAISSPEHRRHSAEEPQNAPYTYDGHDRHLSMMDLSLKAITGERLEGECFGDMKCCCQEIAGKAHLHQHHKGSGLHFCSYPSEDNQIFFEQDGEHIVRDSAEFNRRFPELELKSPLLSSQPAAPNYSAISPPDRYPADIEAQITSPTPETHTHNTTEHLEHHHHHVKTPLARLLSIGLQTTLAITLHKFPEGFIVYSTSQADSRLGWTIFLSMFIHNFVEGFTMTLPIYLALNSRWKALLVSGTIGGLAQPFGALVGYFVFRYNNVDVGSPFSMALIGSLMAVTSGFLTYVGLQMLTSAISFGGKQETVMLWTVLGIALIAFTNVLI